MRTDQDDNASPTPARTSSCIPACILQTRYFSDMLLSTCCYSKSWTKPPSSVKCLRTVLMFWIKCNFTLPLKLVSWVHEFPNISTPRSICAFLKYTCQVYRRILEGNFDIWLAIRQAPDKPCVWDWRISAPHISFSGGQLPPAGAWPGRIIMNI